MHEAGGLLYYDGANLNAILGKVRPGDMGFDVIHMNLHKTFSTPHGGGGPGSGAVGVGQRLLPFLPVPVVGRDGERYRWLDERDLPQSIGRLSGFMGNTGVLLRAWVYMRILGAAGMRRVAEYSTLNANYLLARLAEAGFDAAYPGRRASHEFIITLKRLARETGVTAMDFAKRLLDHGYHAPTTYFPLLVPECLLIEPTETETREELDGFVEALVAIRREAAERRRRPSRRRRTRCRCAGSTTCAPRASSTSPGSRPRRERSSRQAPRARRGFARALRQHAGAGSARPGGTRRHSARNARSRSVVVPLGLWLGATGVERALLVGPMFLVLVIELAEQRAGGDGGPHRSRAPSAFGQGQGTRIGGRVLALRPARGQLDAGARMAALVCGSLAFDTVMVYPGRFRDQILPDKIHMLNVSFMVPTLRRNFGGCAGNIAFNLKLLECDGHAMGAVGHDFGPYRDWMVANGMSLAARARDRRRVHRAGLHHDRPRCQPDHGIPSGRDEPSWRLDVPRGRQHHDRRARTGWPRGHDRARGAVRGRRHPVRVRPGPGDDAVRRPELAAFVERATWITVNDYEAELLQERMGLSTGALAARVKGYIVTRGAAGPSSTRTAGGTIYRPCQRRRWSIRRAAATPTARACCTA